MAGAGANDCFRWVERGVARGDEHGGRLFIPWQLLLARRISWGNSWEQRKRGARRGGLRRRRGGRRSWRSSRALRSRLAAAAAAAGYQAALYLEFFFPLFTRWRKATE